MRKTSLTILLLLIIFSCFSQNESCASENARKQTVIVVAGTGGTIEYQKQFTECANLWEKACSEGNANYISIGLQSPGDSQDVNDLKVLQDTINNQEKEGDTPLWLVLIGHGTFDGRNAKFNLRGPDVSSDVLAKWLEPIKRPIAIINAFSSSSPFLNKLSGKNRVIISATKSGYELSYSRFGLYISNAIGELSADLDKDGQTSLLEAFLAASRHVEEFYSAEGRLATEHALIDDNADTLGTSADWYQGIKPSKKAMGTSSPDGYRANQFCLIPSTIERKLSPDLKTKRDNIEMEIIKLRDSKDQYSEDEYFSKLEKLSTEIARIYEQLE